MVQIASEEGLCTLQNREGCKESSTNLIWSRFGAGDQQLRSQKLQLQLSVLHERQQKEHLTCQLHQLLHSRQQVQEPTAQDLELQSQYLQQQRREAGPLLWEDFLSLFDAEPKPEWIGESINYGGISNQWMKPR